MGHAGRHQRHTRAPRCVGCGEPLRSVRLRTNVLLCRKCYSTDYYIVRSHLRLEENLLEQIQDARLVA